MFQMESIVDRMQDESTGVLVRTVKSFMSKVPSVFTGNASTFIYNHSPHIYGAYWVGRVGIWAPVYMPLGPQPLAPGKIDGLLVPPGKAYQLLTDCLITGKPLIRTESAQKKWFISNHPIIIHLFGLLGYIS